MNGGEVGRYDSSTTDHLEVFTLLSLRISHYLLKKEEEGEEEKEAVEEEVSLIEVKSSTMFWVKNAVWAGRWLCIPLTPA